MRLDQAFCRSHFPQLSDGVAYLENGGGTLVPREVIERITAQLSAGRSQPMEHVPAGRAASAVQKAGRRRLAAMINAPEEGVVIGPSTTLNTYILSQAMADLIGPEDAVLVTDQDHEANGGAWRRLAEARGADLREWRVDPVTGLLDPADLPALLADGRVALACFPHASNLIGAVNPVAEIARAVKAARSAAIVVADGVAWAGHGAVDVQALGVDVYLFSLYKVYGPHLGVMAVDPALVRRCANQNHFFHATNWPENIHPGGTCYDLAAGVEGVPAYFQAVHDHHFDAAARGEKDDKGDAQTDAKTAQAVFGLFREAERVVTAGFAAFLARQPKLTLLGPPVTEETRVPVFALAVQGADVAALADHLAAAGVTCGAGDFYAKRLVDRLAEGHPDRIDPARGVLRISFAHYNTLAEAQRVMDALEGAVAEL
ncbi:MAG: aminotransferase class V-fold PLP-dependent enzyme [Rhodospirillaceae bacterium]